MSSADVGVFRSRVATAPPPNLSQPLAADEPVRALHQTVKNALDPQRLLNPGKFLG
jgi:hypothetical protein